MAFRSKLQSTAEHVEALVSHQWPAVDLTPPTLIRDSESRSSRKEALNAALLELTGSRATLAELQEHLSDVQLQMEARQNAIANTLAPVNALPPELLREVFLVVYLKDPFSKDRVSISHVCSRWRAIATSTPHIWTTLKIRHELSRLLEDWVQLLADRSRPLPMDVIMMTRDGYGSIYAKTEFISRLASVSYIHPKDDVFEAVGLFPYSSRGTRVLSYPTWAQSEASVQAVNLSNSQTGFRDYSRDRALLGSNTRFLRITTMLSFWDYDVKSEKWASLKHVVISGVSLTDFVLMWGYLYGMPSVESLCISNIEADDQYFEEEFEDDEKDIHIGSLKHLMVIDCYPTLLQIIFGRKFWKTRSITRLTLALCDQLRVDLRRFVSIRIIDF